MERTTRDEPQAVDEATNAPDELAGQSLTSLPPGERRRAVGYTDLHGLTDRSDADLVRLMSHERSEPESARNAWDELYRRHSRYVLAVAARVFGDARRDPDAVADIVCDTFLAAFAWAGRQTGAEDLGSRFESPNAGGTRRRVLGWLAMIASRTAARRSAELRSDRQLSLRDDLDLAAPTDVDPDPRADARREFVATALRSLTPNDADALRESLPWYQIERGEFAFPRGEAARVAASLGISAETLRQRRCRSLRRLRGMLRDSR